MPMANLVEPQRERPRPVLPFLGLTFAITWSLQLPGVLARQGLLAGPAEGYLALAVLGVLGPMVAATILASREGALRPLYSGLARWRVPVGWYAAGLLLPGVMLTVVLWLLRIAGHPGDIAFLPGAGALVAALVIAVGEEVGWRGYALPRLQDRVGPFIASVIIGAVWTVWHVPMFLGLGIPLNLLPVMLLYFVGGSLMFTWLYNGSGGSLLIVVAAHVGAHLNNSHAALPEDVLPLVVHAIVYAAIGYWALRRHAWPQRRTPRDSYTAISTGAIDR